MKGTISAKARMGLLFNKSFRYTIVLHGQPEKVKIVFPTALAEFKVGDVVELSLGKG